jgi:hypothetical protein
MADGETGPTGPTGPADFAVSMAGTAIGPTGPAGGTIGMQSILSRPGIRPADGLHSHEHAPYVLTIGPPPAFHPVHTPTLQTVVDGAAFAIAVWGLLAVGSTVAWVVLRSYRPRPPVIAP